MLSGLSGILTNFLSAFWNYVYLYFGNAYIEIHSKFVVNLNCWCRFQVYFINIKSVNYLKFDFFNTVLFFSERVEPEGGGRDDEAAMRS